MMMRVEWITVHHCTITYILAILHKCEDLTGRAFPTSCVLFNVMSRMLYLLNMTLQFSELFHFVTVFAHQILLSFQFVVSSFQPFLVAVE